MKLPFKFIVLAILALAILTGCGTSSGGNGVPKTPPPPPTGTNYTTCNDNAGGTQLVPNWESDLFQSNYKNAIQALVAHLNSQSYASKIGYIRVGLGKGGEINLPPGWKTNNNQPCYGGYTAQWGYAAGSPGDNWNTYLAGMVQWENNTLNSPYPVLVSITPITDAGIEVDDFLAPVAFQNGISYGNQGLQASDITAFNSGQACGGDWCSLFNQYPPQIRELQTIGRSCPAGVGACSGQQGDTGPLPPLLQFATGQTAPAVPTPANDLEIYYQDWLVAYDPNDPDYATYGSGYRSAIAAAASHATMQVLFPDPSNGDIATYVLPQSTVTGVVIDVDWSDIQPSGPGNSFDWSITDASINQWISAGAKKVNLVFQNTTYGGNNCGGSGGIGSNGQDGSGNCAMPPWMWTVLK